MGQSSSPYRHGVQLKEEKIRRSFCISGHWYDTTVFQENQKGHRPVDDFLSYLAIDGDEMMKDLRRSSVLCNLRRQELGYIDLRDDRASHQSLLQTILNLSSHEQEHKCARSELHHHTHAFPLGTCALLMGTSLFAKLLRSTFQIKTS